MVSTPQELLERCVKLLTRFVQEDAALAQEQARAQIEFFRVSAVAPEAQAERRFLEWFLFERPSLARGEAPVFTFQDRLLAELPEKARDFAQRLPESVFGVFEVEEELDGRWSFQDLLTQREYAVLGAISAEESAGCRNFAGRIYPSGEDEYFVSPSTRRFVPEKELWAALREDLQAARQAHSGNRISQAALETILWPQERASPAGEPDSAGEIELQEIESGWRALMPSSDSPFSYERMRAAFAASKNPGALIAETLDRLAFETKADIDRARLLLLRMKEICAARPVASELCGCGSKKLYDDCCRSTDALKAFDEGKARGENLDALFRKLEEDMGLDPDEEEDPGEVPSEPELTPLVDEFLWETKTKQAPELREMFRQLEAESETPITHIEEITEEILVRHLCVAFPLTADGKFPEKAQALLRDLLRFALWADLEQGTKMAAFVETIAGKLEHDLPRLARANRALQQTAAKTRRLQAWKVREVRKDGKIELQSLRDETEARLVSIDPAIIGHIQAGDLAYASFSSEGKDPGQLQAVLPALAEAFLG